LYASETIENTTYMPLAEAVWKWSS
jgi:hypothetical protein